MTQITGFKHITVAGMEDFIALITNEGTVGLMHDVPHDAVNNCLLQTDNNIHVIVSSPVSEEIHEELLLTRTMLMMCIAVNNDSSYCCLDHNHIGTSMCNCGNSSYSITNVKI